MASDLVALQLILQYWTTEMPGWALSLIFWVLLILATIVTVRIYGEVSKYCATIGTYNNRASLNIGSACLRS